MATINQTIRNPRETKIKTYGALEGHPQAKGVCLKVFVKKPRKPNSAQRKMAQVKLSLTGNIVNAYIQDLIKENQIQGTEAFMNSLRTQSFKFVKAYFDNPDAIMSQVS